MHRNSMLEASPSRENECLENQYTLPQLLGEPFETSLHPANWAEANTKKSGWLAFWPEIQQQLLSRKHLVICMGFDGVLSPLSSSAREASLPVEIRALLSKLHRSPRTTLAFLSGRSLADLRTRVGMDDVIYVGNHGTEVSGAGLASFDGLASSCRSDLVDARAFLTRFTRRLDGVELEDKGLSLTVHWRLAGENERSTLRELMRHITQNYHRLRVFDGEAAWDIRGRASWNKGDAIRQIVDHFGLSLGNIVYLGNEATDDGTFLQLTDGLTFCMGESHSASAKYILKDLTDVTRLLLGIQSVVDGLPAS